MAVDDTPLRDSDAEPMDVDVHRYQDGLADQCLLYLLGELRADQAQSFEQQVLVSADAAKEIARQSKLLSVLGGCSVPTPSDVVGNGVNVANVERNAGSLRRYASIIAAIAVALFLVFSLRPSDEEDGPDIDDARIAAAWADTDTAWSELSNRHDESETIPSETFANTDSIDFVGPFGDEAVPSWMLVALDSSSDLLDATTDDGRQLNRESESGRL